MNSDDPRWREIMDRLGEGFYQPTLAHEPTRRFPTKRAARRNWFRERLKNDPVFRLKSNMRSAVAKSVKGNKQGRSWEKLVGYTCAELRAHLEARFTDGMTWDNMGKWHIDHIRPLASFDITGPHCLEFKAAWALSNLQPLWGIDNSRKWAFMPELGVTSVDNFDGEAEKSLQEQECHRSGSNGRPPDYKSVCRPTQPARIANKYGRQA